MPSDSPQSLRPEDLLSTLRAELHSLSIEKLHLIDDILSCTLLTIRTLSNNVARINTLPTEILVRIFDYVRHVCAPDIEELALHKPASRFLIAVTHVCRHWRTIALDSPDLWSDVVAHDPSAVTFVERARGRRLSLRSAVVNGQLSQLQKRLIWRVRPWISRLSIVVETPRQLFVYKKTLRELAPSLEELSIVAHDARRRQQEPRGFQIALFGGRPASSLTTLSISTSRAVYPIDHFPRLASLYLSGYVRGRAAVPLKNLLYKTPVLQVFHYHSQCDGLREHPAETLYDEHDTGHRVSLPKVKRFCIALTEWFHPGFHTFLSTLDLPQTAIMSCFVGGKYIWSSTPGHFPATHLGNGDDIILSIGKTGVTFAANSHGLFHARPPISATRFAFDGLTLVQGYPLSYVRVLRLDCGASWTYTSHQNALSDILRLVPALTELVVHDYKGLVPQLCHVLEQSHLVPNLTSVTYNTLDPRFSDPATSYLNPLFRATDLRARLGHPLKRLKISSPGIAAEQALDNMHGVEWISFTSANPWTQGERSEIQKDILAHWRTIWGYGHSFPGKSAEEQWEECAQRQTEVRFGTWGHRHSSHGGIRTAWN